MKIKVIPVWSELNLFVYKYELLQFWLLIAKKVENQCCRFLCCWFTAGL